MPKGKKRESTKALGKNEDLTLQRLFKLRNDRGGVDSQYLTQENIKAVREAHFPDRSYRNFAPLFRNKARKWKLSNALIASRKAQGKYMTLALINFVFIVFTDFFKLLFNQMKIRKRTKVARIRKTTVSTVKVGKRRATKTTSVVWLTIFPS